MIKTIDIAAQHNFQYVNIHPGCAARVGIDFEKPGWIYAVPQFHSSNRSHYL